MLENKDCLNLLKSIPSNSINLIVTDPPYGINFHGKYDPDSDWDNFTDEEFEQFNIEWMTQAKRVLTENGSMWCFGATTQIPALLKSFEKAGFIAHKDKWKSIQRQKGRGSKNVPKSLREEIFFVTKSDKYLWNDKTSINFNASVTNRINLSTGKVDKPIMSINNSILCFKMPYYLSKTEKMIHSCQKSILLLSLLIEGTSNKGDKVLDLFAGSGSTGVACKITDREFIGSEIDKSMFEQASKWIDTFDVDAYKKEFML